MRLRGSRLEGEEGVLSMKRTSWSPRPALPIEWSSEPIRTGRGDEGEWGREGPMKTDAILKKTTGFAVPHSPCIPSPRERSIRANARFAPRGEGTGPATSLMPGFCLIGVR
jgi:hypothetical protein